VIKFPRLRPSAFPFPAPVLALIAAAFCAGPPVSAPSGSSAPYGLIWLEVDQGPAEVSLDGEFLDAGVWLISVSPGDHDVRIRKPGFRAYAGRVSVPAGGSVHLDVRLQPGAAGDS
jgi:hypothetical protein